MNYIILNGELYHHGILGQKWGVRRYQNKDGSLTAAGRNRVQILKKTLGSAPQAPSIYKKRKTVDDIREHKTDDEDVIKKGQLINRVANSGENIDDRHKYVSLTSDDKEAYESMWDMLELDLSKPVSYYEYESKHDLRIATGKRVLDDVIKKYGDAKIADLAANEHGSNDELYRFIKESMHTHLSDIIDTYKKQQYDGIVDIEDWVGSNGIAEYPVILLDPEKSISLVKETKR